MLTSTFGYQASVVLRSRAQMRAVVERAPEGFGADPAGPRGRGTVHVHVRCCRRSGSVLAQGGGGRWGADEVPRGDAGTTLQAELDGRPRPVRLAAATYPSWAEVPPEDRNVLRPLYGDEEFEQFAGFGSYIGYRVGITDTGDWLYFVAGD